jgi:hypothetical protein
MPALNQVIKCYDLLTRPALAGFEYCVTELQALNRKTNIFGKKLFDKI